MTAGPVLVTGSAGQIGAELTARLPGFGWTVRGFDRVPAPGAGSAVDTEIGELGDPDALAAAMDGAGAVVHLAGVPTEQPWPALRAANVDGLVAVFEAARRAGIRRVVYASSNHATGFTPLGHEPLPANVAPRPDTLYGVTKAFGEALARYYVDRYGLQIACLRIGTFAPTPPDRRSLATWLSPGDCTRLVDACLRAPGLTYALLWGISANTRRRWSLAEAEALGYVPHDDAEDYADTLAREPALPGDELVGGGYTTPGFGIDEVIERAR